MRVIVKTQKLAVIKILMLDKFDFTYDSAHEVILFDIHGTKAEVREKLQEIRRRAVTCYGAYKYPTMEIKN